MVLLMDFTLNTIDPIRIFPVRDITIITQYAKVLATLSAVGYSEQLIDVAVPLAVALLLILTGQLL